MGTKQRKELLGERERRRKKKGMGRGTSQRATIYKEGYSEYRRYRI